MEREILANNASNTSVTAGLLRMQALFYALKKNSWQSVELLLNAGVTLPNLDSSLKGLYPRERDVSSNDETAVPNCLCSFMLTERVKVMTLERLFQEYQHDVFSDNTSLEDSVSAEHFHYEQADLSFKCKGHTVLTACL